MNDKKQLKMFIDQYGYKYFAYTRKELIKEVCPYTKSPKVAKMYKDKKDGSIVHCGYIISDHWLTAYIPLEVSTKFINS